MDDEKKRKVMLGIVIASLVLAGAITAFTWEGGGGGSGKRGPMTLLCVNPECGVNFELTANEFKEEMMNNRQGPMGPMMMRMPVLTCPDCGEQSAYVAKVCPECDTVFVAAPTADDYADRCPECDYSATEERVNSGD